MVQKSGVMERRWLLAAAVLLVVAGAGVGAYVTITGDAGPAAVNQVPADVDAVVHVDGGVTDDAATTELVDSALAEVAVIEQAPNSTTDALDEFERQTGLDPDAADEVVVFSKQANRSTGTDDVGVIVHGNWEEEAVVDTTETELDREWTETTYNGQTMYRPINGSAGEQWIGVLGDGQFVFGSESVVRETVDVVAGNSSRFDGRLRSGFEDAPDGLVTFSARVPTEQIPEQAGPGIELTRYRQVTVVSGSYYSLTNGAGVELHLQTNSTEAAQDLEDVTGGVLATARLTTRNESVEENLDEIEVEREGETVIVSYEQSIDDIGALIRYYQQDLLGEQAAVRAPDTDWESPADTGGASP